MIIAIDGPAASGKGTLARRIADHYGYAYLDTGLLYRAVACRLNAEGAAIDDEEAATRAARGLSQDDLRREDLRQRHAGEAASIVAAMPGVRKALVAFQRHFAQTPPGAVLDGRDIGTVVCPDAEVKLFVTASLEERARRRWKELGASGSEAQYRDIEEDLRARDERDANRAVSPMRQAGDAHLLDTTNLDIETAFLAAIDLIDGAVKA
ncbi:MAG: (d)CMP kinase [Rhodobiaceae bacterium]|nr:(d)CMP kinase [Rhodobiaceae bacterium]